MWDVFDMGSDTDCSVDIAVMCVGPRKNMIDSLSKWKILLFPIKINDPGSFEY